MHLSVAGTVRENLDPAGQHSERELIAALKAVKLWEVLAGVSLSQAKAADAPHHGPPATATAAPIAGTVSQAVARSIANSTPISIQGEVFCRRAACIPACQPQLAGLLMLSQPQAAPHCKYKGNGAVQKLARLQYCCRNSVLCKSVHQALDAQPLRRGPVVSCGKPTRHARTSSPHWDPAVIAAAAISPIAGRRRTKEAASSGRRFTDV